MFTGLKQLYFLFGFLFLQFFADAQLQDSIAVKADSLFQISPVKEIPSPALKKLVEENRFLNSKGTPGSMTKSIKKKKDREVFFYLLTGLVFMLGITKTIYPRYFSNMFRVFFNSSLRQSQLTDQLVQDKLPSLIFNIFFVIVLGMYFYLLMDYFNLEKQNANWHLLWLCIAAVAVIYLVKYVILKFTGWISGYKQEADIYTFIVFLINKIIAVCLLPMVIVMAFAEYRIANISVLISLILIGTMLMMRFLRSYGLLQHRLKVSGFHFFLYIFSVEVLPILIIYKAAVFFFSISL